MLRKTSRTVQ